MSQSSKQRVAENDSESDIEILKIVDERHQADLDALNDSDHEKWFKTKTKLALVDRITEINKRKSASYKVAINHVDWSQLDLDDLNEDEGKDCLNQILATVNKLRTLDEMLDDYLKNYRKYELKRAPNAPQLPPNPIFVYIIAHRAKFEKEIIKKNPNVKIKFGDVSKYGSKQYHKLPQEKIDRDRQEYELALEKYRKERKKFLRLNPELIMPRKRYPFVQKPKKKKEKLVKPKKEVTKITPFRLFYNELKETIPEMKYHDARAQYNTFTDQEKLSYINRLLNLDTQLDKILTGEERKIIKLSSGMPVRPLSAYNTFVQSRTKNVKHGKGKRNLEIISETWKTATDEEKKIYEKKFQDDLDEWKEAMMVWIKTLPIDQRAEQIAKHKLFDSNKRKRDESVFRPEDMEIKIENEGFENVIEIAQIEEDQQNSSKKNKLNSESEGEKNQTAIESKEESIEKQLAALGEYPSQSVAHYFMKTKGERKSMEDITKAYEKLTRAEKRKLFIEMLQAKNAYMSKMKSFALKLDPKHNSKVIAFHHSNKEQQDKSVSWHTASGTDISSESSNDEDDDSDES